MGITFELLAFEDRIQVTKLFVSILERLSIASNESYLAKKSWETINDFMTDTASKNLKTEFEFTKMSISDDTPFTFCANNIPVKYFILQPCRKL